MKDSFQNLRAGLGIGAENLMSGGQYGYNPITRSRQQLEWMFRGSWIVRCAVKTMADDMTREGIELTSDIDPENIAKIMRAFSRLKVWNAYNEAICWSRLYGGSIGVYLIEGQKLEDPLRLDTITKGQFKGICVLDRWMVAPPGNALVTDYGPDMGQPLYYDIIGDSLKLPKSRVHHSRVIRFDGEELPHYQRVAENGWGLSVIEPLFDQLVAFDSAIAGVGQLVFKSHLRTLKIPRLREILAGLGGPAAKNGLLEQMNNIRAFQSSEGLTLLDGGDEFETHTFTFAGLPDILQQFASHIAGSLETPVTRLFGTSPGGLNATGQSDLQTYYDRVKQKQEDQTRSDISTTLGIIHRSELGVPPEKDLDFEFASLWQMDENMKADIAQKNTMTIVSAAQDQIVSREVALKELKQQSLVTGIWTNITVEDIEEAKNDPPPGPMMQPPAPGQPGEEQPAEKPADGKEALGAATAPKEEQQQPAPAPVSPNDENHGLKSLFGLQ